MICPSPYSRMSYSECLTPYSWVFYSECPPYSKCLTPYSRESYSKYFTPYSRESYSECSTPYKCALLRIDTIRSPASHKNPSSVGTWRPAHNIKNDVLTCRIQMVKRDNKSRTRIFTLSKQAFPSHVSEAAYYLRFYRRKYRNSNKRNSNNYRLP